MRHFYLRALIEEGMGAEADGPPQAGGRAAFAFARVEAALVTQTGSRSLCARSRQSEAA
jgi:hypothetical protein